MKKYLTSAASALVLLAINPGCSKNEPTSGATASAQASASAGSVATPAAKAVEAALANFEGVIEVSVKSKQKTVKLPLQVKKGLVRFDFPEDLAKQEQLPGKVYAVVNAAQGKASAVVEARKTIIDIDFKKLSEQAKAMRPPVPAKKSPEKSPKGATEPPPKVTKTGHIDTVAGYKCEDWQITTADGTKGTVCIAQADASWLKIPSAHLPTGQAWMAELLDGKHFPLRMVGFDKTGAEETRVELTRLEKKSVPDSTFDLPAGYKRLDFQQFMQQAMGAAAMGMGPGGAQMPGGARLPPGVKMTPQMKKMMEQMQARVAKAQAAQKAQAGQKAQAH